MPANKPIILNQEEDKKRPMEEEMPKENTEQDSSDKNIPVPDDYEIPDKLIGDDLEIEKVKDGKDPDIDSNRERLGY